jgi:site-specific recombinase XerD
LRAGNNIRFIQKALGHKSLETVQVYLDIADNEMRQAAEKVSSLYK